MKIDILEKFDQHNYKVTESKFDKYLKQIVYPDLGKSKADNQATLVALHKFWY